MENLENRKLAIRIATENLKFNGTFYKGDKKGIYFKVYVGKTTYSIRYDEKDEFTSMVAEEKTKLNNNNNNIKITEKVQDNTFGTGCITTAAKANKFGFDAIEN